MFVQQPKGLGQQLKARICQMHWGIDYLLLLFCDAKSHFGFGFHCIYSALHIVGH